MSKKNIPTTPIVLNCTELTGVGYHHNKLVAMAHHKNGKTVRVFAGSDKIANMMWKYGDLPCTLTVEAGQGTQWLKVVSIVIVISA